MAEKRQTLGWSHVWDVVNERREEIPLTWQELKDRGGPSPQTMRKMRRGIPLENETTRSGLCHAIGWEPGSVGEVLAGRPPILKQPVGPASVEQVLALVQRLEAHIEALDDRVQLLERPPVD